MKNRKRRIVWGCILFLIFTTFFPVAVLADSTVSSVQTGIKTEITTDKEAYTKDENIVLTISVTNTNSYELHNVILADYVPSGLKAVDSAELQQSKESLKPGETTVFTVNLADDSYVRTSLSDALEEDKTENEDSDDAETDSDQKNDKDSTSKDQNTSSNSTGSISENKDESDKNTSSQSDGAISQSKDNSSQNNNQGTDNGKNNTNNSVKNTTTPTPTSSAKADTEKKNESVIKKVIDAVKTGDTSNPLLWIALFIICLIVIIIIIIIMKHNGKGGGGKGMLSIFLCLTLSVALLPHSVYAEQNDKTEQSETIQSSSAENQNVNDTMQENADVDSVNTDSANAAGGSSDIQNDKKTEKKKTTKAITTKYYAYDELISTEFTVDGRLFTGYAKITYEMSSEHGISFTTDDMNFNEHDGRYYLSAVKNTLKGTVENAGNISKMWWKILYNETNAVAEGDLTPDGEWEISNFGLLPGENCVEVSALYKDGYQASFHLWIVNLNEDNLTNLNLDKADTDNDGVLNYQEKISGTDPSNPDTDGDGLDDYEEIACFGTDPLSQDTDQDGISDFDEDCDGDNLSNGRELSYGTDPFITDTDGDLLSDGDEIDGGTDPLSEDTDGDKGSDYWELSNGFDPLTYNDTFDMNDSIDFGDYEVGVSASLDGSAAENLTVTLDSSSDFDYSIPGRMTDAVCIEADSSFKEAVISFSVPEEYQGMSEEECQPVIYRYDTETQLLTEVATTISNDTAVATIDRPATYILLNKIDYNKVWDTEIKVDNGKLENEDEVEAIDIAFVLDYSQSMDDNDPDGLRKELTKKFIAKLRDGVDRTAVVKFAAYATTLLPMSDDKEAAANAVEGIVNTNSDGCSNDEAGTNGSDGIRKAIDTFDSSSAPNKYIVFLTDGEDNKQSYQYSDLESEAKSKGIVIYTIGLGEADEELLNDVASATGGKYYYATAVQSDGDDTSESDESELTEIFGEIQDETIDYELDSNNDGISDYYTKLMCDGTLRTGTGKRFFQLYSYDDVQSNADCDGDGLLNGDEVCIVNENGKVYLKFTSYPDSVDSDRDGLTDLEEKDAYNSLLKTQNAVLSTEDVDWVTDSENFISDKYKDFWDNKYFGWAERGSVWIGNKIFGTAYQQSMIYQSVLLDYLSEINSVKESEYEYIESVRTTTQLYDLLSGGLEKFLDNKGGDYKEYEATVKNAEEMLKRYDGSWLNRSNSGFASNDDFYEYCDSMYKIYSDNKEVFEDTVPKLKFSKFAKNAKTALKVINVVSTAANVAADFQDAWSEFDSYIANLNTINDDLYILETIADNASDSNLAKAANTLKNSINVQYEKNFKGFFESGYFEDATLSSTGELVHAVLGVVPYIQVAEVFRSVSDFVLNISGVAKECSKLYGISASAELLSSNFTADLKDNTLSESGGYYIDYTDPSTTYNEYMNLLSMRYVAEEQMIVADRENTILTEWLFSNFVYNTDDCEQNKKRVTHRINSCRNSYVALEANSGN